MRSFFRFGNVVLVRTLVVAAFGVIHVVGVTRSGDGGARQGDGGSRELVLGPTGIDDEMASRR
jgi:hypothetical protein